MEKTSKYIHLLKWSILEPFGASTALLAVKLSNTCLNTLSQIYSHWPSFLPSLNTGLSRMTAVVSILYFACHIGVPYHDIDT